MNTENEWIKEKDSPGHTIMNMKNEWIKEKDSPGHTIMNMKNEWIKEKDSPGHTIIFYCLFHRVSETDNNGNITDHELNVKYGSTIPSKQMQNNGQHHRIDHTVKTDAK